MVKDKHMLFIITLVKVALAIAEYVFRVYQ